MSSECTFNPDLVCALFTFILVLGGNQREMDRAKAQKKLAQLAKGKKGDGVSHTKRAES